LPHRYRLFCAGFGSGKSEAMANAALIDACQSSAALIALYAPTFDLIRLITAPRIVAKLHEHGIPHQYNKAENVIYTSAPGWGDFILRTMDNPERIVGYESYRSHLDELDTLKFEHAKHVWNQVIARNRQRPAGVDEPFNQVSAYTTPEGFNFAHWRWVLHKTDDYGMVQAASYSNPFLPPDYVASLRATYPEQLVTAYIEGQFVNLTSGTVYNSYDREKCRSTETIKDYEPLFIGQDFNVANMCSVIYVKRVNEWHAVEELTGIYDTPALVDTLSERYRGHSIVIYPDASGKSRKTVNASTSDIALLQQAGYNVRTRLTNPPVKNRVMAMNKALSEGVAKINDFKCRTLANSLERQTYDKNGEPDKQAGYDHGNDAASYPIAYELPIRRISAAPIEQPLYLG
jgi:hypothetical protein